MKKFIINKIIENNEAPKIIINLCLKECPKSVLMELI
jgi:hypothetical protein